MKNSDAPKKPRKGSKKETYERWHCLALIHGYNELAKASTVLGEKVWLRLARNQAEEMYLKLGGELKKTEDDVVLLIEPKRLPCIKFTVKDIELMRETVRQHDAKGK
jgi:hypothetical protein